MRRFSADSDLTRIRASVMNLTPSGVSGWGDFHSEAARDVINDLRDFWYSGEADRRAVSVSESPFDVSAFPCGWDYTSEETAHVFAGEWVKVLDGHDAGGTAGGFYLKTGESLPETDLALVDFSDTLAWEDISAGIRNDVRYLTCYRALFLIYRYLAGDMPEKGDAFERQRDYFLGEYEKELGRVLQRGLPYDWGDGPVQEAGATVRKTTVIW
jgi:hypothetical protein